MTRRQLLALAGIVPAAATAAPIATWLTDRTRDPVKPRPVGGFRGNYFPNVVLRTHEGRGVRFYDDLVKNRVVTFNFMYANCKGVCVPVTSNLVRVHKLLGDRMGRDIFFYSLTLEPAADTPEVLARYASAHDVGRGWTFLTGEKKDIELLRQRLGFVDPDPVVDADRTQHAGMVLYGNEAKQRWAACPGMGSPEWIARSIRWVV